MSWRIELNHVKVKVKAQLKGSVWGQSTSKRCIRQQTITFFSSQDKSNYGNLSDEIIYHFISIITFQGCCVFWPAFWCCVHPKVGQNTFFSHFQLFFFFLNLFQWISVWNKKKTFRIFPRSWPAFGSQPAFKSNT